MKLKILKYLPVILLFVVSCSGNIKNALIQIEGYDEELTEEDNLKFDSFDIINLEMTDKSIVNSIQRVEIVDSLLIVQSQDKVLVFNHSGKFLYQYGERGNGPSEYVSIRSFVIDRDNKELTIIDESSSKIITFDIDGTYISNRKYDREFFLNWTHTGFYIDDDNILFDCMLYNDTNNLYTIVNYNKEEKNVLCNFPVKTDNCATPIGQRPISYFKDKFRLIVPFDNKIYTLKDGKIVPEMIISTKKKIIGEERLKIITDYSIESYIDPMNNGDFTGFTGVFETDNYIVLEGLFGSNYFIIDKALGKGKLYGTSIREDMKMLPLLRIIGCGDNYLIGEGLPMLLKDAVIENAADENIAKLKNHIDSLNYDSNPCLFMYKLK